MSVQRPTMPAEVLASWDDPEQSEVRWLSRALAETMRGLTSADRCLVIVRAEAGDERLFSMTGQTGWENEQRESALDHRHWARAPFTLPSIEALLTVDCITLQGPNDSELGRILHTRYGVQAFVTVPLHINGESRGVVIAHWVSSEPPSAIEAELSARLKALTHIAGLAMASSRLHEQLLWESAHDPVTKLLNRNGFERELAARLDVPWQRIGLAVLCCRLDRFARVKEMLGRSGGDRVLHGVGRRLRELLGKQAAIARIGEDEFVIILEENEGAAPLDRVLQRILEGFELPLEVDDERLCLQVSLGVSQAEPVRQTQADIFAEADHLVAAAEGDLLARGRKREADQLGLSGPEELFLDTELHAAITSDQFSVAYQPQIDMRTAQFIGVEALARWTHPSLGVISPTIFIPLAEMNGLIVEIGKMMIETACRDARRWRALGLELKVSVNVSGVQLEQPDFARFVTRVLRDEEMNPELLTLEITESRMIQGEQSVLDHLRGLADLGVKFSIDDFGTGFSSLTRLVAMPIAELKIDQSFVRSVETEARAVVGAIVGLARSLNLEVVGEGAETDEQLELLRSAGCHRAQGYAIAPPASFDLMTDLLLRARGTGRSSSSPLPSVGGRV